MNSKFKKISHILVKMRIRFFIKIYRLLLCTCFTISLISCGGGGSDTGSQDNSTSFSAGESSPVVSDNASIEANDENPSITATQDFTLFSQAIDNGEWLDEHKCEKKVNGVENSLPLAWSNMPDGTKKLALTMNGVDTGNSYLLLWDIDSSLSAINHGEANNGPWFIGPNKDGTTIGYTSPCSPSLGSHEYVLTLYALSATPSALPSESTINITNDFLTDAIKDVTIDTSVLSFKSVVLDTSNGLNTTSDRCSAIKSSIIDAGFGDEVTINCDTEYANLHSSTYPEHDLMNGITGSNEQIPVPAKDYSSPIRLNSTALSPGLYTTRDAALGVAVNGVPIYDYSSGGELDINNWIYDSNDDTNALGQLDDCGGHAGRGDDYHYHKKPSCMIEMMLNKDQNPILGWGFDGYPIYGDQSPDGTPIGSLGVCNHIGDETFGYRYHTSNAPPYIIMCLVGETDSEKLDSVRVQPLQERTSGQPITVNNLSFITDGNKRTLSYSFGNSEYFISYTSLEDDCYSFESKTVEDGGSLKKGIYCR